MSELERLSEELRIKQEKLQKETLEKEKRKEKESRKDYWLHKGIIVKVLIWTTPSLIFLQVMNKQLADGKLYKQKGVVIEVEKKYTAKVKMLEGKETILIDQDELETVIPVRLK